MAWQPNHRVPWVLSVTVAMGLFLAPPCQGPARAQTQADAAPEIVRVGYTSFAPYSTRTASGLAEGYSIDLIRLLLDHRDGRSVQFVPFGSPGPMLEALERGDIDATSLLGITPGRAELGIFSDPVIDVTLNIFLPVGAPNVATEADLAGLRIAASRGSLAETVLRSVDDVLIVPRESSDDLVLPLLRGDVDAIAAPSGAFLHSTNRAGLTDRFQRSDLTLHAIPTAILVRPDRAELVTVINSRIAELASSGQLANLAATWLEATPARWRPTASDFLAAVLAAILVLGALSVVRERRRRASAREMSAYSNLLNEALNATGASVLLADENLKPLWWNDAYSRNYPHQLPFLNRGADVADLVTLSAQNGTLAPAKSADEAEAEALERIDKMRRGVEVSAMHKTPDGRYMRDRTVMLPSSKFAVISQDVTPLVMAQEEESQAKRRLELANENLRDFSKIVAHDLKAPLRNIALLYDFIEEDMEAAQISLPVEITAHFGSIQSLVHRQHRLIDDLLEYAKTDGAMASSPTDPLPLLDSAISLANVPDGFTVTRPDDMPAIMAAPAALETVIRNLVSNAVRHHDRPSGEIVITWREINGRCEVAVADDGPGIPDARREKVFEPFETLKPKGDGGGTGLGLAFVRKTVAGWGGSVSIDARGAARGTCVRFDLPLAESVTERVEKVVRLRA